MKNFMRKVVSLMLATIMAISMAVPALAVDSTYEPSKIEKATAIADVLYKAGLFLGTGVDKDGNPIYALEDNANRAQAMVMLVRIMGKETEATKANPAPFTDIPDWAAAAINYGYAEGLTNGIGDGLYGSNNMVTNTQYISFCLRALGYNSGDFRWDAAHEFAYELGALKKGDYDNSTAPCSRADMVLITYTILNTKMKNSNKTLADKNNVKLEQPVMPTEPTLPKIVTDKITVIDETDPKYWLRSQKGNLVFNLESDEIKFGTIFEGLTQYTLDYNLTPEENFKRLSDVWESYRGNWSVLTTKWKGGEISFNVGPLGSRASAIPGITASADGKKYTMSGMDLGCNWSTGIPKNYPSRPASWNSTVILNTMCFVDYTMGQQVFIMLNDYFNEGTAKVVWDFKDEEFKQSYTTFFGDCGPITKEFVEKYGLTYISGEYNDPKLVPDGMGAGDSHVIVSNGNSIWKIQYRMPNFEGITQFQIEIER